MSFSTTPLTPTAPPSGSPCGALALCFKISNEYLFLVLSFPDLTLLHTLCQSIHVQAQMLVCQYSYIYFTCILHFINAYFILFIALYKFIEDQDRGALPHSP